MVKCGRVLVRRRGAILVWLQDVSSLHVVARKDYFRDGDLGLHVDDPHLPRILIEASHSLQEFVLPLEPWHIREILVRPHDGEAVADPNTLVLSPGDIDKVAART